MEMQEGYMTDAQGRLVPIEHVKQVDLIRDELVGHIITGARHLQQQLIEFKKLSRESISEFVELAASEYDTSIGGLKGNIGLTSYDGRFKVQVQVSENIRFDERIQAAKSLIDECIHEWTEGARSELRALVDHAFQADKEGKISISRILGLTRLAIEDGKWRRAMEAIRDSMQVVDTATYMRMYERDSADGAWRAIPLDLAKL